VRRSQCNKVAFTRILSRTQFLHTTGPKIPNRDEFRAGSGKKGHMRFLFVAEGHDGIEGGSAARGDD